MYDVAEILEEPGFLMVRAPGSSTWPSPGDTLFSIDPYLFDPVTTPIEILSCGYQRVTYLNGKLGCLFSEKSDIDALEQARVDLKDVDTPQAGESFDDWRARAAQNLSDPLATYLYSLGDGPLFEPEVLIYVGVVAPKCLPRRLGAVLYDCTALVRWDIGRLGAERRISEFLGSLGVRVGRIGMLDTVFWIGNGAPRLINTISDDDLVQVHAHR